MFVIVARLVRSDDFSLLAGEALLIFCCHLNLLPLRLWCTNASGRQI
ncbi:hypothetical protein SGI63_004426 [Enterobacter cloacae]|nr:hypothetical protein [Enterobacter cloacae]